MTSKRSILRRLTRAVSGTDKLLFTKEERDRFATFYEDKWDWFTSDDVIAESFVDYWWDTDRKCRRCSECGRLMRECFCVNGGDSYYCEKCLPMIYTSEECERVREQ